MNGGMILVLVLLIAVIADTQFINYENEIEKKCSGETVYFNWTYSTSVAIFIVEWKVNGSRIASDSGSFSPVTSYIGRVFQISNGQISLGPLTIADSGTYKAEVSYVDGTGHDSNQTNLIVYDVLSKETEIEESSGILRPSFYDSSITYTWTSPNNVTSTGQYLTVSISGNYTLCVSEGKAGCLNSTLDPCTTKYVKKVNGLTNPSSAISSDMSPTVSEPQSTVSSDMPATVSEIPPPPVTTSSAGLSQEIVIAIVISSALAAGVLIFLVVLVVRQCRRNNEGTPVKNKENHFANKQNNLIKKADLKSYKPRKLKLSEKKNTKLGSTSLDKKKDAQLENFACKDRMYQHYPQTNDCWNINGNQHVFNISHNEGKMVFHGKWHDNYLRPHSRPNNRMPYQSRYPEYPGHNEGMFQYYRADNLYRGQQMYQRPYGALYDMHIISNKQDDKGRPYDKNWDLLY